MTICHLACAILALAVLVVLPGLLVLACAVQASRENKRNPFISDQQ